MGIKIQLVACFIPAVVVNIKKLRENFKETMITIIDKYVRAVLFIMFGASIPQVLICKTAPFWRSLGVRDALNRK